MGGIAGFNPGKPRAADPGIYWCGCPDQTISPRQEELRYFKAAAAAGVKYLSKRMEFFTADDVWAYLGDFNANYSPERRAISAAFSWGRKEKLIEPTDQSRKSVRKLINHGRYIKVWRSLVYERPVEKS